MHTVEEVLDLARTLPRGDRERLRAELDALESKGSDEADEGGLYEPLIDMIGQVESDYTDVASDKYRHVAAAVPRITRRPGSSVHGSFCPR